MRLSPLAHDRDVAGLTYVYPVVSRRSGGVSLGINLNPNDACNWRCIYCQVPGLKAGRGPQIDLELLRRELDDMLEALLHGDFMARHVPEHARRLEDVAFSGNGEPTSSPDFAAAVEVACEALERFGRAGDIPLVLITNGSRIHAAAVQRGLRRMAACGGAVWYKLDSATAQGQRAMNSNRAGVERARKNLAIAARLCPTWIQTLVLERRGKPPCEEEQAAYLALVEELVREGIPVRGVLLYGLARVSHQPEAAELAALPRAWLEAFAARIRARGLPVKVSV